jgi:hypothetical protein
MQDADDCPIRGEDANPDGYGHCNAKNQRHEERNHGQPPFIKVQYSDAAGPTFVYAASSI